MAPGDGETQGETMVKVRAAGTSLVLVLAMLLLGSAGQASAAPVDPGVSTIRLSLAESPEYTSELVVNFAQAVPSAQAKAYIGQLQSTSTTARSQLGPTYIGCGGSGNWSDQNGRLSLQLT